MSNVLAELHAGLQLRATPESVLAKLVALEAHTALPGDVLASVATLVKHYDRRLGYYSMPETYRRHPGLTRAYASAYASMQAVTETAGLTALPVADPTDPVSLRVFVTAANLVLGLSEDPNPVKKAPRARTKTYTTVHPAYTSWTGERIPERTHTVSYRMGGRGARGDSHGHADPRTRMTAQERHEALPGVSVRTYRRAVRTVNHLQQRTEVLAAERDREAAIAFGKGRLAHTISYDDFAANTPTAAFVAYYVARLGMRTVFTSGPQARPMDDIAQALLDVALADPEVRADVIAKVLTRQSVLALLTEQQKGDLLGTYYEQMAAFSRSLRRTFDPKRDRTTMVARPGDDSSTWNAASRAFNQARTGWLNLTAALDLDWLVELSCPGKVPALVAADVAHWHDVSGGGRHTDTQVFAKLPLPWDVVLDGVACSAELVRAACTEAEVDAEATGWTRAYRQDALAACAPTPDLVHGVVVSSPLLAGLLRKDGAWAGRVEVKVSAEI